MIFEADGSSGNPIEAILGLGYESISVDSLPTWLDSTSGADHSFGMYLTANLDDSVMTIPGFDSTHFKGPLVYHSVISQSYWTVNLTSIYTD